MYILLTKQHSGCTAKLSAAKSEQMYLNMLTHMISAVQTGSKVKPGPLVCKSHVTRQLVKINFTK